MAGPGLDAGDPRRTLAVLRPDPRPGPGRKLCLPPISTSVSSSSSPEPNEVEDFELNLTGGVPGPTSQDLQCEIKDSPCPVVLHIEAAFKVLRAAGTGQLRCPERLGWGQEGQTGLSPSPAGGLAGGQAGWRAGGR